MISLTPTRFRFGLVALAIALLSGCATTENTLRDTDRLLADREAAKQLPTANLSSYAMSLGRFGRMLDVYKDGDPVVYMQTRSILDATNLSNPLVGSEIPGDITEMVRTAVNRIGARIVYVPYHPDYLISQAQLGAKFGVTMPDFLITGALTEFDRALSGTGRSNSASVDFGKGKGETALGADFKRTAILSALALDLNLVSFSTQQMVPRIQASNVIKVLNFTAEDNASLGFYGDSFGFKLEGPLPAGPPLGHPHAGRPERARTDGQGHQHAVLALHPERRARSRGGREHARLVRRADPAAEDGPGAGHAAQVRRRRDRDAAAGRSRRGASLQKIYSTRYPQMGESVDVLTWQGFEPLFFGVPMPWDAAVGAQAVAPSATPAATGAPPARVGG